MLGLRISEEQSRAEQSELGNFGCFRIVWFGVSNNLEAMEVGFLGLGIMGTAMARNLLKKGFKVTVWNRSPAKASIRSLRTQEWRK